MKLLLCTFLLHFSCLYLPAQIRFENQASSLGVADRGANHGLSIIDFDQDGLEDIFIATRQGYDHLYHQQADGSFKDVAFAAGLSQPGASRIGLFGDINNDGFPDLYIGTESRGDFLYLNVEGQGFIDISAKAGMQQPGETAMGAAFADVDADGWLDLYVARQFAPNSLYINDQSGGFQDRNAWSGAVDEQAAMGVIFFDYDHDRDQDLYLVHDGREPNILYQNNGSGQFTDVSQASGADYAGFGMGVDVADVNQDGWMDIYIANLLENTLLLNQGDGSFADISTAAGVDEIGMGWGTLFADMDNDGDADLLVVNGELEGNAFPHRPNASYSNQGNGRFQTVNQSSGLATMGNSFGVASGDLNRDGKVDLVVANMMDTIGNEVFINQSETGHHWLKIHLQGTRSNRMAIGARISLLANGIWQHDEIQAGSSWASQNSPILHVGLGNALEIDSLLIEWPSGLHTTQTNIQANQLLNITEVFNGPEQNVCLPYPNPLPSGQRLYLPCIEDEAPFQLITPRGRVLQLPSQEAENETGLHLPRLQTGLYLLIGQSRRWKLWVE